MMYAKGRGPLSSRKVEAAHSGIRKHAAVVVQAWSPLR
jgi:hypothetical protein